MTSELTAQRLARANRVLPQLAFNPLRDARVCQTCLGSCDIEGVAYCNSCRDLLRASGSEELATLVVPLSYAGEMNEQLRKDIRNYKDGYSLDVRASALARLSALTWHFFHVHAGCIDSLGTAVTHVTAVPSGAVGRRDGRHPIEALLRFAPTHWERFELERVTDSTSRTLDPQSLVVPDLDLAGKHIVVFDDTWTTGAKAQSAALRVRQAGAAVVTIVVAARILNAGWAPTARLLEVYPKAPWRGDICPVSGGDCPSA